MTKEKKRSPRNNATTDDLGEEHTTTTSTPPSAATGVGQKEIKDVQTSSQSRLKKTDILPAPVPPPPAEEVPFTYVLRLKIKSQRRNVVIYRDMSDLALEDCIRQAFQNGKHSALPEAVKGLFLREADVYRPTEEPITTLYPLSWVTKHPGLFHLTVYEVVDPTPVPPVETWWTWFKKNWREILAALVISAVCYYLGILRLVCLWAAKVINIILEIFPRGPLRVIYRFGPAFSLGFAEFGFWQGLPIHEICARITGQPAAFWNQNRKECNYLFGAKEDSFLRLCEAALLFSFTFYGSRMIWDVVSGGRRARPIKEI